jgi:hypothetical protein
MDGMTLIDRDKTNFRKEEPVMKLRAKTSKTVELEMREIACKYYLTRGIRVGVFGLEPQQDLNPHASSIRCSLRKVSFPLRRGSQNIALEEMVEKRGYSTHFEFAGVRTSSSVFVVRGCLQSGALHWTPALNTPQVLSFLLFA